ncbi:unnamed protein product [Sphagnum tenellum]
MHGASLGFLSLPEGGKGRPSVCLGIPLDSEAFGVLPVLVGVGVDGVVRLLGDGGPIAHARAPARWVHVGATTPALGAAAALPRRRRHGRDGEVPDGAVGVEVGVRFAVDRFSGVQGSS